MYKAHPVQIAGEKTKGIGDQSGLWRVEIQVFEQGRGWLHYAYEYDEGLPYAEAFTKSGEITKQMNPPPPES